MKVAEIGCSWNGDFGLLDNLMNKSKEAGFNAVKLQAFNEKHWKNWPQYPKLKDNAVTEDNVWIINQIAIDNKIEWFATPCYPEAVEWLNPYVNRFKIRYADNKNKELIDYCYRTGKPVIISGIDIYCIPKYPTQPEDIDFKDMANKLGYSNHCKDWPTVHSALSLGLEYYEIHMVLYHSKQFVDDNVSYTFEEINL